MVKILRCRHQEALAYNLANESIRGSRIKAQLYGGEHNLLYKKDISCILNSIVNFAVRVDQPMER